MNVSSQLSPLAKATLLLTGCFSKPGNESAKPLTNAEWRRLLLWLNEQSATPADLLDVDPTNLLQGWHDARVTVDRIITLMNRGQSLALAMEKWQKAGLWVTTRYDSEYPVRLKQRLQIDSPPLLFGYGDKALLNVGGLAVVGSRNACESDLAYTEEVGAKAASENIAIVSGGARGVDEAAMLGAMRQGGVVIGVMADSLLKAVTNRKWQHGLMGGHTVLLSPYFPEVGFSAGNALGRNKYIYCLADSALVIHSGTKGGTLNGAQETLKKSWVPLWVKQTTDKAAANADLVAKGGRWLSADSQSFSVAELLKQDMLHLNQVKEGQTDLFSMNAESDRSGGQTSKPEHESAAQTSVAESEPARVQPAKSRPLSASIDFYQLFLSELQHLAVEPVSVDELVAITGLLKSQLNEWLKRAIEAGVVKKLNNPVRYQCGNPR